MNWLFKPAEPARLNLAAMEGNETGGPPTAMGFPSPTPNTHRY
jgi:hypothetical protein